MFQISKSKWFKECDSNSIFFHTSIKSRSRRNVILSLKVGEVWLEGVSESRLIIFQRSSRSQISIDLFWMSQSFALSVENNLLLIVSFSSHELDIAITLCDGKKTYGLDDFSFSYLKRFWNLNMEHLKVMFDHSHWFSLLPYSFASYFVILIPKNNSHVLIYVISNIFLLLGLFISQWLKCQLLDQVRSWGNLFLQTNLPFIKIECQWMVWWLLIK